MATVRPETTYGFQTPRDAFGALDVDLLAEIIAAAADVAVVVDDAGTVVDVAFGGDEISEEGYDDWIGRPLIDTVAEDSREKVAALLATARSGGERRQRHVNHPSERGPDVPVLYTAIRARPDGPTVAIGRDLRSIASLQHRLVEAQQAMERDFSRLRQAETRYRLLFDLVRDAALVVDAATRRIVEANAAALALSGRSDAKKLVGKPIAEIFADRGREGLEAVFAGARARGRADDAACATLEDGRSADVEAAFFRQGANAFFLVRLQPRTDGAEPAAAADGLLAAIDAAPEAIVLVDDLGRVRDSNQAFLDLTQHASREAVLGEPLDRWIGRPGVDLSVILGALRDNDVVRLFETTLQGDHGVSTAVELSASIASRGADGPLYGFVIRDVGARLGAGGDETPALPKTVEQLAELVGRVPLKDIVRETTDVIERLCIEAALEITGDNRASAAEMLGLSRQSLYVKLRRYGLGDLDGDGDAGA